MVGNERAAPLDSTVEGIVLRSKEDYQEKASAEERGMGQDDQDGGIVIYIAWSGAAPRKNGPECSFGSSRCNSTTEQIYGGNVGPEVDRIAWENDSAFSAGRNVTQARAVLRCRNFGCLASILSMPPISACGGEGSR